MKEYQLYASARELTGRGPSRRLRARGKIPAVIYGPSGSRSLCIERDQFCELWKQVAGASTLIQVCEEGRKPIGSLIQEVQRDPLTDEFIHIDLKEISADKEIQTTVAVHILGESVGVKNESGLLEINSHELSVRCLPRDLPPFIEVDVTNLHVGTSLHVNALKPIPGVTFHEEADRVVVSCVLPAAAIAEEEAAESVESTPKMEESKEEASAKATGS